MSSRSLAASELGQAEIQKVLTTKSWSREDLAKEAEASRATATNFCTGKNVDRKNFVRFCELLELDWEIIAGLKDEQAASSIAPPPTSSEIDSLVQQVRHQHYRKIDHLCGTMQLLDVSRPVNLDNLYIDVNMLEQRSSRSWFDIEQIVAACNEDPDRFNFFGYEESKRRIPGLEAVQQHLQLLVLGRPGAGKSTFLQHIAVECNEGRFHAEQVPIFLRLRNFTEDTEASSIALLDYLRQDCLSDCSLTLEQWEQLLREGRLMLLLDGLDEVPEQQSDRIVREIRQLADRYHRNQWIVTCRIAAQTYRFDGFTDVEVADFDRQQAKTFVAKWFGAVAGGQEAEAKAETLMAALEQPENQRIRELAVTPILLNLACVVFASRGNFPSKRSELYQEALLILFNRWDEERRIKRSSLSQRQNLYRDLTSAQKRRILGYIASETFEQEQLFFKHEEAQRLITRHLAMVEAASQDAEGLKQDSEAILKVIEAQHGLLVERARRIYSFSHLTFHEYFTAQQIVQVQSLQDPQGAIDRLLDHLHEPRWREVFFLVVEQLPNADYLLQQMKQRIDRLMVGDKFQQFLRWVQQKSESVEVPYKPAAIRAFYFDLDSDLTCALDFDPDFDLARTIDRALDLTLNHARILGLARARDLDIDHVLDNDLVRDLDCDNEAKRKLQELYDELPDSSWEKRDENEWWEANSEQWTKRTQEVMTAHRNISHNWKPSDGQIQKLKQYYEANKLLVECLNSECYVSRSLREEIEATLLLPIASLSTVD